MFSTTTDLFLIVVSIQNVRKSTLVSRQINEHLLINNNLHDKFQSSYKSVFSTETAPIKIIDDILYALNNKSFTVLIMIDMSAVFDTVDRTIFLNRLSKCLELIIQHFLGLSHIYLMEVSVYLYATVYLHLVLYLLVCHMVLCLHQFCSRST